jgi:two-component system, LytTR family, sensor histidine kinase AlgZ
MLLGMQAFSFNSRALIANFVIWSVFIIISLSASFIDSSRAGIEFDEASRISGYLISFAPWMLVTPVFYWFLARQHRLKKIALPLSCTFLLLAWAPFVVFFETASYMIMRPADGQTLFEVAIKLPIFYWVYCLMLFGVVLGACLSLLYYRRANENKLDALRAQQTNVELQLQLSELQIQSLLSQLEPHFLFNSLNAIASLVRIADKKEALTAIKRLSDLLRYALEASNQKFVSFDQELAFVRDYLSLQQLRFEDKLTIDLCDERQQKNQECPPFLLQIFVENAIKHGLEKSGEAMRLTIRVSDRDAENRQRLSLLVENTHQSCETDNKGLGIGLTNLRSRLKILYAEAVEIITHNTPAAFCVQVTLPVTAND